MNEIKLTFTKHAKDIMVKRGIDEASILNAVKAPTEVFLDRRSNLMVAIKGNTLALVVVYNVIDNCFEIVRHLEPLN